MTLDDKVHQILLTGNGLDTQHMVDERIASVTPLGYTPQEFKDAFPIPDDAKRIVLAGRRAVERIISREDKKRLFAVVGPCSIHDPKAAVEYAQRISTLSDELHNELVIIMRVYGEKPRSALSPGQWTGFLYDPHMNGSFDARKGFELMRQLYKEILKLGVPIATESLDTISAQYFDDAVTYHAIGARSSEDQMHRQLASGLSGPVGLKNTTSGNLVTAVNSVLSAVHPQSFTGLTQDCAVAVMRTKGMPYAHLILRGSDSGPNYDEATVQTAQSLLREKGIPDTLVIDASHANSKKKFSNQPAVVRAVVQQRLAGNHGIVGFMLESHLFEGNQSLPAKRYGVSVTDECLGWDDTEALLREVALQIREYRK